MHRTERLSIVQANFTDCQCVTDRQVWARPLDLHKTGVAAGLRAARCSPGAVKGSLSRNQPLSTTPRTRTALPRLATSEATWGQ